MSFKTKEPGTMNIRKVTVHSKPGSSNPISPPHVTLTDEVYKVVWDCKDLRRGATLLIAFREDPRGPFFRLEFNGSRVTGYGNRGPEDTSQRYEYEARIEKDGDVTPVGTGTLSNEATKPIHIYRDGDPPPGPPWENDLYTPPEEENQEG